MANLQRLLLTVVSSAAIAACGASSPNSVAAPEGTGETAATPAAPAPSPSPVSEVAATAIAAGEFQEVAANHPTTGTVQVVNQDGGATALQLGDSFKTVEGPAVYVVLVPQAPVPEKLDGIDYVELGPLQRVDGAQTYAIPAEVDVSNYGAVAIWCRQFDVTFGAAALQ